jgi:hypothetical protein
MLSGRMTFPATPNFGDRAFPATNCATWGSRIATGAAPPFLATTIRSIVALAAVGYQKPRNLNCAFITVDPVNFVRFVPNMLGTLSQAYLDQLSEFVS